MAGVVNILVVVGGLPILILPQCLSGTPGEGHGFDHISDLLSSYQTVRMLVVGSAGEVSHNFGAFCLAAYSIFFHSQFKFWKALEVAVVVCHRRSRAGPQWC